MQRRRTVWFAGLVAVILALAAAWLWHLEAGGVPRATHTPQADPAARAGTPQTPRPANAPVPSVPAPHAEPSRPAPRDPPAPETAPETAPDEPAITPQYDDRLRRTGAVITFDLRDAQGQWLVEEPVSARLFRRLGPYLVWEWCQWVFDEGVILCDGESGAGLEPGSHVLEIDAGCYGSLLHRFEVQRGEVSRHELRTPLWRRIVSCRFEDTRGNLLPFLPAAPSVSTTRPAPPQSLYPRHAPDVLRHPPVVDTGGGGGGGRGGFSYRRVRGGGGSRVFLTDGGLWHLAVFAGTPNRISAEGPGGPWPGENLVIEGDFDSPEPVAITFRLDAPADLETAYAGHTRFNAADPGQKSLLAWAARKGALPAPDAPAELVAGPRLVLELEAPAGLEPRLHAVEAAEGKEPQAPPFARMTPMRRRAGLWFAPVTPGLEYWLVLGNERGLTLEPERFTAQESLTRLARRVPPGTPNTLAWPLVPTLAAWAIHRQAGVYDPAHPEQLLLRMDCGLPVLLADPAGRQAVASRPVVTLRWQVAGQADVGVSNSRRESWRPQWVDLAVLGDLPGDSVARQLELGTLAPPAPARGLFFRAVDAWGAGLPWVKATLHELADDTRAARLREIERAGHKDGWRPRLSHAYAVERAKDPYGLNEEDLRRDRAREHVGEEFERACARDGDLAWYLRTGAWYDSYTRLQTDDYGYFVEPGRALVPGRKYVLYLWSNSRNDLYPDARVVFQAEAVTDLGVITLPAYAE
jgi:hypothetical protein